MSSPYYTSFTRKSKSRSTRRFLKYFKRIFKLYFFYYLVDIWNTYEKGYAHFKSTHFKVSETYKEFARLCQKFLLIVISTAFADLLTFKFYFTRLERNHVRVHSLSAILLFFVINFLIAWHFSNSNMSD